MAYFELIVLTFALQLSKPRKPSGLRPRLAWLPSLGCFASGIFAANVMALADLRKRAASCCNWSDCPERNTVGHNRFQQDVVASASHQASAQCSMCFPTDKHLIASWLRNQELALQLIIPSVLYSQFERCRSCKGFRVSRFEGKN